MKRGQVTIFIIGAVVIIAVIAFFFLFKQGMIPGISGDGKEIDPNMFLKSCLDEKVKDTTEILLSQGGYISNPLNKTFRFNNETEYSQLSYLCYTQNYYSRCINQQPMLIQHVKDEIYGEISEDVKNCFDELVSRLTEQDYVVDAKYNDFEVKLLPKKIEVDVDGSLTLTKNEQTTKKENFRIFFTTRLYDLAIVVQEIVSQEARFCNFENLGFMLIYPQFNIDRIKTGDLVTIYSVQDRTSKESFNFAIKTCTVPPGM